MYNNSREHSHSTTKTIRVFVEDWEKITNTVETMQRKFFLRAEEITIAIRGRGKRRNVPGYPHAIDCLLSGMEPEQYVDRLISKRYRTRIKLLEGRK